MKTTRIHALYKCRRCGENIYGATFEVPTVGAQYKINAVAESIATGENVDFGEISMPIVIPHQPCFTTYQTVNHIGFAYLIGVDTWEHENSN